MEYRVENYDVTGPAIFEKSDYTVREVDFGRPEVSTPKNKRLAAANLFTVK